MKAFNFKLKTLLKLRQAFKEKALFNYGKAVHEAEEMQHSLSSLKHKLKDLHSSIKHRRENSFYGPEEEHYQRSIISVKNQILNVHSKLKSAHEIREAKRKIFLKADADVKSLEKLKERKKIEHDIFEYKKEESQVDDVITARFNYNLKSSIS